MKKQVMLSKVWTTDDLEQLKEVIIKRYLFERGITATIEDDMLEVLLPEVDIYILIILRLNDIIVESNDIDVLCEVVHDIISD